MYVEAEATPFGQLIMTPSNMTTCNSSLSPGERSAILVVYGCFGVISSVTCLAAIIVFFLSKMCRKFMQRLVLYMLVASLFHSLVISVQLLGVSHDFASEKYHKMCAVLGFFSEYSPWVLVLSTTAFTITLTCHALVLLDQDKLARTELLCALLPWLFPLLVAWVPFLHHRFGDSGIWCWIGIFDENCSTSVTGVIEQFALLYADMILLLAVNSVLMASIIVRLCMHSCRKWELSKTHRTALKITIPLLAFPLVYGVCTCITFVNRIYRAAKSDDNGALVLWLIHAITAPSWGFLAGLTFLIYILIRRRMESKATHTTPSYCVREGNDGEAIHVYPDDDYSMENLKAL